jgi:hypothetical protein
VRYSKLVMILTLVASSRAIAQDAGNAVFFQSAVSVGATGAAGALDRTPGTPVQGAPYSATITNESIQTLADGNRIVQTSTGTTARDSQGRTRQDTALPAIGNLSVANAPHLVFILDPVAQASYTLDLTGKTAQKMPTIATAAGNGPGAPGGMNTFFVQNLKGAVTAGATMPPLPPPSPITIQKQVVVAANDQAQVKTEDLGSQTMEGVFVNGVRTTRTIPAGQIGNDRPLDIVTEVWTSPDLKTVVYSKRSDARMGEQTFRLTNIVRTEPDPSLFTVPADFKVLDGLQPIIYRTNQ